MKRKAPTEPTMTIGLVLGLALRQAWTASTMFDAPTLFDASLLLAGSDLSLQYLVSALAFGGFLLFLGLTDRRHIRTYTSARLHFPAACCACAGTLLLVLPLPGGAAAIARDVASGLLTGFGTSVLTLAWATTLARKQSMHAIVICAICGTTLGFLVYYLLVRNLAAPFAGLVLAAIPLLEFGLLVKSYPPPFAQRPDGTPYFSLVEHDRLALFKNMGAPVALFGLALGILRVNAVKMSAETTAASDAATFLWMLIPCAIALGMAAIISRLEVNSWARSIRTVAMTIAVSSFVLSLFAFSGLIGQSAIVVTNWMCIEGFVWILFASISQYFRASPVYIYGCLRGLISFAGLLGALLPPALDLLIEENTTGELISVVFVPLILFLLGAALFPNALQVGARTASTAVGLATPEEVEQVVEETRSAAAGAGGSGGAGFTGGSGGAGFTGGSGGAGGSSAWGAGGMGGMGGRGDMGGMGGGEAGRQKDGKFSRQVRLLAKTYLLTERETDVLFELAKGQSPASIQEKLHISAGTVKTHTRHIYEKLDIHKRQEIYERLEEMRELDGE